MFKPKFQLFEFKPAKFYENLISSHHQRYSILLKIFNQQMMANKQVALPLLLTRWGMTNKPLLLFHRCQYVIHARLFFLADCAIEDLSKISFNMSAVSTSYDRQTSIIFISLHSWTGAGCTLFSCFLNR